MTENIGYAALEIIPSTRSFESKLAAGTNPGLTRVGTTGGEKFGSTFGSKASSSIHAKFAETAKYIIGPLIGAFAVEKIGALIGESIKAASDLAGAQNRVKLIFGASSEEVVKFSEHAAKSYGVADFSARNAAAGFGVLFKTAKLSREENAKSSVQFTKLAADLAAFGHTDFQTAFSALQKGLGGATRGLKPYGILIDSSQQKAEALRLGLLKPVKDAAKIHAAQVAVLNDQVAYNDAVAKNGKGSLEAQTAQAKLGSAQDALGKAVDGTIPPLTAQQKVLANQSLILQQTQTQQGQFGRTSGDLAQQQKILSASFDNAKDRLGKGLLPVMTSLVGQINKHVIPAIDDASRWFEKDGANAIHKFTEEIKPLAESALPAVKTSFHDILGFAKDLAPLAKGIFDSFNKLPASAQKAILVGATVGYLGKKSGLLAVGTKALTGGSPLSTAFTLAKPLPVFVTNEGFGGAGGPGGASTKAGAATAAEDLGKFAVVARFAKLGVGAQIAKGILDDLNILNRAKATPSPGDPAALKASRIGAADGLQTTNGTLSINFDKLSHSLERYGAASKYAAKVQESLQNAKVLNPENVNKVQGALLDLAEAQRIAGDGYGKVSKRQKEFGAVLLGPLGVGATGKLSKGFRDLPSKVQTIVETPGLLKTRADVRDLGKQYDLTPKQVRTVYHLEGLDSARVQADRLRAHIARDITIQVNMHSDIQSHLDGVRRP